MHDAFVTKLNAAGTALVYSTYLGGSGDDGGLGIAVDQAGNAYVTGLPTPGSGFPGTAGSLIQSTYGGGTDDAFVTKLNAAGTALVYSTYLGGSGDDDGNGIAVDAAGNAYVTGSPPRRGPAFPAQRAVSSRARLPAATPTPSSRSSTRRARPSSIRPISAAAAMTSATGSPWTGRANAYVTGRTDTPGSGFPGTAGSLSRARLVAAAATLDALRHEAQRGRHGPRLFDLSGRQRR